MRRVSRVFCRKGSEKETCNAPSRRSSCMRPGSKPSERKVAACSATRPPRRRTGRVSSSACACASARRRSAASPRSPITAPSTPGGGSTRANGTHASSGNPARGRCGCWRNRVACPRANSRCSAGLSASSAAGGMATKRSAITSSRGCRTPPSPGSIAREATGPCMDSLPEYAELHCVSNFSFLRGASHPEELVERAHALGYAALALTDECSLAGAVRAHVAAKECGLKLIFGTEILLQEKTKLVLLASDRRSYGAICSLITTGRRRGRKGSYALG